MALTGSAMDHPNRVGITAPSSDSSSRLATTAFVQSAIQAALISSAVGFGPWTSYTPTVTSVGGNFTSLTAVSGRFIQVGKFVHAIAQFFSSTPGPAAGPAIVSLPVAFNSAAPGGQVPTPYGRENAATGKGLTGLGLSSAPNLIEVVFDDASNLSSIANIFPFVEVTYEST
jgi:hypothetical protein